MKSLVKRITNWEQWPFKILYAPISLIWVWYIIRSRSVWFFTPSNPKITFGGMEGEPKREMYDLLPKDTYPKTVNVLPSEDFSLVQKKIIEAGISFPLIVKPEVGGQGILFRKFDTEGQLRLYHEKIPVEYIIQELILLPMEVSIFYIRYPDQEKGFITGFLHKIPLQVTGDGKHTLYELIMAHPKANKREAEMRSKHGEIFERILPEGERFMLSYAANHNRGARFINLQAEVNDKLVALLDGISHSVNDFFYGRYDIMCSSLEDLKEGKNFMILEYNGCGAEPNHFYDTGYTLYGAYREILKHWKFLYQISRYNYKHGIKYWPLMKGVRFLRETKKHYRIMKNADKYI